MIKYLVATFFTCGFIFGKNEVNAAVIDSVGTVVKNGKNFTIHKVAPKETFFGLARQYGVPVAQIQQANPGVTTLAVGQTLYVPGRPSTTPVTTVAPAKPAATNPVSGPTSTAAPAKTPATAPVIASGNQVHTVQKRQTLLGVARQYNVTMADIRKWNNLTADVLQEGQTLVIGPATEPESDPVTSSAVPTSVASTNTEIKPAAPVPAAKAPARPATRPEVAPVRETSIDKVEREETKYTESLSRVSENGLAELMEAKGENSKYLALHKTAPIGTILQVKNTQNNQSVYVRVAGKLPENNTSDKVIIKVSKRAYQKLAADDSRIRVEVNYMP